MIEIRRSDCNEVIPHKVFVFSGGEVQVKVYDFNPLSWYRKELDIYAHLTDSNSIMELMLIVDALRRMYPSIPLYLKLPYIPYARQDRAMTQGESLAVKVFADIINGLNFRRVEVLDAHSDVALALINNVVNIPQEKILTKEILGDAILVSPDAGSLKKVSKVAQTFGNKMVRADKTRSVIDGSITGTVVYSEHVGDQDFLIVDDICDGGRTFIELAKELRKITTGKIKLYVTHGIFSKGFGVFNGVIDEIYCAVPFPGKEDLAKIEDRTTFFDGKFVSAGKFNSIVGYTSK